MNHFPSWTSTPNLGHRRRHPANLGPLPNGRRLGGHGAGWTSNPRPRARRSRPTSSASSCSRSIRRPTVRNSLRPALPHPRRQAGQVKTYHDQVGYWLWEPATGNLIHTLTIPRGQVAMAYGQAETEAPSFEFVATRARRPGICSNPFLEQRSGPSSIASGSHCCPATVGCTRRTRCCRLLGREESRSTIPIATPCSASPRRPPTRLRVPRTPAGAIGATKPKAGTGRLHRARGRRGSALRARCRWIDRTSTRACVGGRRPVLMPVATRGRDQSAAHGCRGPIR